MQADPPRPYLECCARSDLKSRLRDVTGLMTEVILKARSNLSLTNFNHNQFRRSCAQVTNCVLTAAGEGAMMHAYLHGFAVYDTIRQSTGL